MVNKESAQPEARGYKVAVASSDGIVVNQHFGRADTFYIYVVEETGKYQLYEKRKVTPVCNGGNHKDDELRGNIMKFRDCKYILVSRIGMGAANIVEQFGIIPMELPGMIQESIEKLITYEQIQNLF